jgi:two-component system phosphate regulon sensor histidine kinase PhoR
MFLWYSTLAVLILACLALHLGWRRRARQLEFSLRALESKADRIRQRHDEAAVEANAQQEALFNSMSEGVLVLDEAGNIQIINRSLREMFTLRAEVKGLTVLEAFRLTELDKLLRRLGQEQTVEGYELEVPGFEDRWLQVNAAAIRDRSGRHHGVILVFHDLTRIKQLENTRQEFVANVSHELRTPLSLIKGYVETLLDGAKEDPVLVGQFLQTIEKHTDRLTFLIEDILTISKLESGQIVLSLMPVDLRSEVARVSEDLRSTAEERQITIENTLPEGLIAHVDADRMEQVFFNLIENSIKYGRKDGHVWVGSRMLPDHRIEISVRDDGPGIPVESQGRVFERFYRVDRARSRETGGTGLGLSIVKHIVQVHGGEVWLKSEPGKGTTFFFTLKAE